MKTQHMVNPRDKLPPVVKQPRPPAAHSPLPLKLHQTIKGVILDHNDDSFAQCDYIDDCKIVVQSCNAFPALVEALEKTQNWIKHLDEVSCIELPSEEGNIAECLDVIESALAQAKKAGGV